MSRAVLSATAAQHLLQVAADRATANNPFIIEDGVAKVRFDGFDIEPRKDSVVIVFKFRCEEVFRFEQPFAYAEGSKLHITRLDGTMPVTIGG